MRLIWFSLILFAITSCAQKPRIEPQAPPKEFTRAEKLFAEKKFDNALKRYKKFVEKNPYTVYSDDAYFKMGYIYTEKGQYRNASRAFARVIRDYPRSQWVHDASVMKTLVEKILTLSAQASQSCSKELKSLREENDKLRQRIEELQKIIGDM